MKSRVEWAIIALAVGAGCVKGPSGDQTLSPELKDGIVKITNEACRDVGGREDAFVELLCKVGSESVRVLLPRREWVQIRARNLNSQTDVGPGK